MRRPARVTLVAFSVAVVAPSAPAASSAQARLGVGAEVVRRCTVVTGRSVQVQCTRAPGAAVRTSLDGVAGTLTPLTTGKPGAAGVSISVGSSHPSPRVVTILF